MDPIQALKTTTPQLNLHKNHLEVPDFQAPQIISPPTVTAKTDSIAIVEWTTDEPSNSLVQFGQASVRGMHIQLSRILLQW